MFLIKRLTGAISLASLLLASCAGGTTTAIGETNITIGAIGPLTGEASSYGIPFQRAVELATKKVNEMWAKKGMTLSVTWEDGACNGKDASTAATKLVDIDSVKVIIGGFCSSETLAISAITEPKSVLLFSPGSSSPDITNAGAYVFRNWPSDSFQGVLLAETAAAKGYKKVAMITETQDYAKGIAKVFTKKFAELGGTVVEENYLSDDTDFKTQITKLAGESPDIYFINPQTDVKADAILKQMKEMGISGPFFLNDGAGTSTTILTTYKDYIEGSYTANMGVDVENADVKAFMDEYKAAYGEESPYGPTLWLHTTHL